MTTKPMAQVQGRQQVGAGLERGPSARGRRGQGHAGRRPTSYLRDRSFSLCGISLGKGGGGSISCKGRDGVPG